jgi:hypothetical protein
MLFLIAEDLEETFERTTDENTVDHFTPEYLQDDFLHWEVLVSF